MKYLKSIYVYRYDEKEHKWERRQFKNVLVSGTKDSYNLSDTLNRNAYVILRVMGDDSADILAQDVVSFCENQGNIPPDDSVVAISVTRNSRGSECVRHTKVVCK